jgi:hypothetical protein
VSSNRQSLHHGKMKQVMQHESTPGRLQHY